MPSFPNDANLRAKMAKINPLAKTPQNGDVLAYNDDTNKFEPKTPELSSIKINNLTDGDVLVYDRDHGYWKNAASAGGVSCLLKVTCTSGATVIIKDTTDPTNEKEFFNGVIESGTKDFAVTLEHSYTLHQEKDAEVSKDKTIKITNLIHSVKLAFITKYAVHINTNNASASSSVSYPDGYDNSGFTPAKMEADGSKFNWGSWKEAFFLPRSCMLKSDGTVDYYLKETDPTLKEDGSASDVANTAYDGNAMMEWGDIWFGFFPDSTGYKFVVADGEDDGLYDYCNIAKDLTRKDHFYTPKYFGSLINGKCRSLSGQTCINKTTRSAERGYAEANGTGWSTESFGERQLINHLLVLMAKTLDTQGAYGNGICNAGSAQKTGTTDSKGTGLFYGTTANKTEGMRVFGMENYWGNMWRAIEGWVTDASGYNLVKMCYGTADGTTENNYSESGTGYIQRNKTTGTSGSEISKMSVAAKTGVIPETLDGETTNLNKYFCDGHWTGSGTYAIVGGDWDYGLQCGAFYSGLNAAPGFASADIGCAVSYR